MAKNFREEVEGRPLVIKRGDDLATRAKHHLRGYLMRLWDVVDHSERIHAVQTVIGKWQLGRITLVKCNLFSLTCSAKLSSVSCK